MDLSFFEQFLSQLTISELTFKVLFIFYFVYNLKREKQEWKKIVETLEDIKHFIKNFKGG